MSTPVALIILDGWGEAPAGPGNAVAQANTPCFDALRTQHSHTLLNTTGEAVGLPTGIMGNSEVGHLNLGAGRIVRQMLSRIDHALETGDLEQNQQWRSACAQAKHTLHIMGLMSDGGVHSQLRHVIALMQSAHAQGVQRIRIHAFTDGRDTAPDGGAAYLQQLAEACAALPDARIASICGRYFAMDRDQRWERTERAYRLLTAGEGVAADNTVSAVRAAYAEGTSDEFIEPHIVDPEGVITAQDHVVFANFRGDRARQLCQALADPNFTGFARDWILPAAQLTCMSQYHQAYPYPVLFPPQRLQDKLGDVVSAQGLRQLRIAETEKYAHVTFFFNGGEDQIVSGEEHCLIPSPQDVATYDLQPAMSADQLTDELCTRISDNCPDLIICNFANPDMVGHTGVISAAVAAVETVDRCLQRLLDALAAVGGIALVTADHGNAEQMLTPAREPHTAHTTNLVPCILVGTEYSLRSGGVLADVAPTLLALLGLPQPAAMTGQSLLS